MRHVPCSGVGPLVVVYGVGPLVVVYGVGPLVVVYGVGPLTMGTWPSGTCERKSTLPSGKCDK